MKRKNSKKNILNSTKNVVNFDGFLILYFDKYQKVALSMDYYDSFIFVNNPRKEVLYVQISFIKNIQEEGENDATFKLKPGTIKKIQIRVNLRKKYTQKTIQTNVAFLVKIKGLGKSSLSHQDIITINRKVYIQNLPYFFQKCVICGNVSTCVCSKCKCAYYCSKKHQKLDYEENHRKICKLVSKEVHLIKKKYPTVLSLESKAMLSKIKVYFQTAKKHLKGNLKDIYQDYGTGFVKYFNEKVENSINDFCRYSQVNQIDKSFILSKLVSEFVYFHVLVKKETKEIGSPFYTLCDKLLEGAVLNDISFENFSNDYDVFDSSSKDIDLTAGAINIEPDGGEELDIDLTAGAINIEPDGGEELDENKSLFVENRKYTDGGGNIKINQVKQVNEKNLVELEKHYDDTHQPEREFILFLGSSKLPENQHMTIIFEKTKFEVGLPREKILSSHGIKATTSQLKINEKSLSINSKLLSINNSNIEGVYERCIIPSKELINYSSLTIKDNTCDIMFGAKLENETKLISLMKKENQQEMSITFNKNNIEVKEGKENIKAVMGYKSDLIIILSGRGDVNIHINFAEGKVEGDSDTRAQFPDVDEKSQILFSHLEEFIGNQGEKEIQLKGFKYEVSQHKDNITIFNCKNKSMGCNSYAEKIYQEKTRSIEYSVNEKHDCLCTVCADKYSTKEEKMVCLNCGNTKHACISCHEKKKYKKHLNHTFIYKPLYDGFVYIQNKCYDASKDFFQEKLDYYLKKEKQKDIEDTKRNIIANIIFIIFVQLARIFKKEGKFKTTITHLNSALKRTSVSNEKIKVLIDMTSVLRKDNQMKHAKKVKNDIVSMIKEIGKNKLPAVIVAASHEECGMVYFKDGNFEKSKECFLEAFEYFKKAKDERKMSEVLNNLSHISFSSGKYTECIEKLNESFKIAKKNNDLFLQGVNLFNIGRTYQRIGNLEKSNQNLKQSLNILEYEYSKSGENIVKNFEAQVYHNIGKNDLILLNYNSGLDYLKKALNTFRGLQDIFRYTDVMLEITNVLVKIKHKDALTYCRKSLELAESMKNNEMISQAKALIGIYQSKENNFSVAEKNLLESLDKFKELKEEENVMSTHFAIVLNIYKKIHYSITEKSKNSKKKMKSISQQCKKHKDFQRSKEHLNKGLKILYKLLPQFNNEISNLVSFVNTKLMILSRIIFMFYKLRLFSEFVRYTDLFKSLVDWGCAKKEHQISFKEIMELRKGDKNVTLNFFYIPDIYLEDELDSYVFIYLLDGTKIKHFQKVTISQVKIYQQIKHLSKEVMKFGEVKINENGESTVVSNSLEEYKKSLKKQKDICRNLFKVFIGKKVSETLKGLLKEKKSGLVIYSHNFLNMLPFQSLLFDDGKYLVEKYSFSVFNSIFLSYVCESNFKNEIKNEKDVFGLLIGNASHEEYKPLKENLKKITELKKDKEFIIIEKKDASKDNVIKNLEKYTSKIIYLSLHGKTSNNNDIQSIDPYALNGDLILSNDEKLSASLITNLKLNTELVVINSCESYSGNLTSSGIMGITQAFFNSGTPSIVNTQFKVNNEIAKFIAYNFFKNLFEDGCNDKRENLRKALLKLISKKIIVNFKNKDENLETTFKDIIIYWTPFMFQGWDNQLYGFKKRK